MASTSECIVGNATGVQPPTTSHPTEGLNIIAKSDNNALPQPDDGEAFPSLDSLNRITKKNENKETFKELIIPTPYSK